VILREDRGSGNHWRSPVAWQTGRLPTFHENFVKGYCQAFGGPISFRLATRLTKGELGRIGRVVGDRPSEKFSKMLDLAG
jgi:hypothetical protein